MSSTNKPDLPLCPHCGYLVPCDLWESDGSNKAITDGEEHTIDCPKCSVRLTCVIHASYTFSVTLRMDTVLHSIESAKDYIVKIEERRQKIGNAHVNLMIATKKSELANLEFEKVALIACEGLDQ